MIKQIIVFILLSMGCSMAIAAPSDSQPTWYQINLIVFVHVTDQAIQSEEWTHELLQPYLKKTVELSSPADTTDQTTPPSTPMFRLYQTFSPQQMGLQNEAQRLSNQSGYQILYHQSWLQTIGSYKTSQWIHIQGGNAYDRDGQLIQPNSADTTKTTTDTAATTTNDATTVIKNPNPANLDNPAPTFWELNGKIKITKSRFFNIYTKLYLTLPESVFGGQKDQATIGTFQPIPLTTFTLFNTRNTKLGELNYIDHPLFGALIQITPFKPDVG